MPETMSFKKALLLSFCFHVSLILFLTLSPNAEPEPVINAMVIDQPQQTEPQEKAIEAVSISAEEIENAVSKLKQEHAKEEQQRKDKIAAAKREALQAKKQRIAEEKRLAAIKREAVKRAEQQRKEQKKLAELKREQEQIKKQQQEIERQKRLEEIHQAKLAKEAEKKRLEAIQAAKVASEKQARVNEAVQKYKALIIQAISKQWILPANVNSQLSCEFRIRLAPDGTVVLTQLSRSSGDSILDRSAETAINKASPLPVPEERDLFELFRDIQLTVRPEQARG